MASNLRPLSRVAEFSTYYDEYMPKVYRYIHYKINNRQLSEDLTSEVFEKAVVNFNKFDSGRGPFSAWIFTIARNVLIDHYKANKAYASIDEAEELESKAPGPEETLDTSETNRQLMGCIDGLPGREQEIIRLKFGACMNNRRISKLTGLSESNVGTILNRSLGKLKTALQGSTDG
jgi:RNA polymerase sigma-70 factor (ECF subfamily)